jgi:hypothetical protein
MMHFVTRRAAVLMAGAAFAVITACGDRGSTEPGVLGPNASARGSQGSADTAKNGGGPHDSSGSHTPAPKPVSKYSLTVHVGTPRAGATDTAANDPVVGATISVVDQTYTFTPGNGADTVHITSTVVATGSSDANGNVTIPDLRGTVDYLIKVAPPTGSALGPATASLPQAFADVVKLTMILHGR